MRHAELTGHWRHRSERALFGRERLVLQLQERGLLTTYSAGHCDTQWVTRWRDAKASDLTATAQHPGLSSPLPGSPAVLDR